MSLLTIIVPTFNRAKHLSFLLNALQRECVPLSDSVAVMVSDNASTDATPLVLEGIKASWPELQVHRHARNVGADENFCSAIESVTSRYFWIIGDDDCPRSGVIGRVVALLREDSPSLVYMQSHWMSSIDPALQAQDIGELNVDYLETAELCARVNVWFTFLSGSVVDKPWMLQCLGHEPIRRFTGTSLVQLGWIYPVVKANARLAFIADRCVLATVENSGGYGLLTVFGSSFARLTRDVFGRESQASNNIIKGLVRGYLPGLIIFSRSAKARQHLAEDPWKLIREQLGDRAEFWLLLLPLGKLPLWLARLVLLCWRIWRRVSGLLAVRLAAIGRQPDRRS